MKAFGDYSLEEQQAVVELLRSQSTGASLAAAYTLKGSNSIQVEMDVHQSSCGDSGVTREIQVDAPHAWMGGVPIGRFFDWDVGQRFLVTVKELPRNKDAKPKPNHWHVDRLKGKCRWFLGGVWGTNEFTGAHEFFIYEGNDFAWGRVKATETARAAMIHNRKPKYIVDVYDPQEGGYSFLSVREERQYGRKHQLILRCEAESLEEASRIIFENRYPEAVKYLARVKREKKKKVA